MLGLRSLRSLRPRRDNQYWVGFVKISAAFGGLDNNAPRVTIRAETVIEMNEETGEECVSERYELHVKNHILHSD
ncbi:hypothetical protein DdX_17843 [Ditylenchus destructor]|uniref:Uncharacterized protein n=1 Tax=Ditylenchus destructor TaxID=166010 RepID=A0AAD4QYM5_9BILA|nr:hypothetical protein DdX_17843 [Ditylenchus destructor]